MIGRYCIWIFTCLVLSLWMKHSSLMRFISQWKMMSNVPVKAGTRQRQRILLVNIRQWCSLFTDIIMMSHTYCLDITFHRLAVPNIILSKLLPWGLGKLFSVRQKTTENLMNKTKIKHRAIQSHRASVTFQVLSKKRFYSKRKANSFCLV